MADSALSHQMLSLEALTLKEQIMLVASLVCRRNALPCILRLVPSPSETRDGVLARKVAQKGLSFQTWNSHALRHIGGWRQLMLRIPLRLGVSKHVRRVRPGDGGQPIDKALVSRIHREHVRMGAGCPVAMLKSADSVLKPSGVGHSICVFKCMVGDLVLIEDHRIILSLEYQVHVEHIYHSFHSTD